ncbi:uncharacterized protein LOC116182225 [Photinus pyralis]|uniref:uncharacterized protein LOC116182225 n=1 Tax=Photinus pyralis TaxID=7054 RepID=UPI0012674D32|nr:uncharacterized protein LOC116182225 [Photinus pyralis]
MGTHRNSYRLPNDVYQTAKMSKLLLLMEKGEAGQFKGKSLDEIEVDLEDVVDCDKSDQENEGLEEVLEIVEPTNQMENPTEGKANVTTTTSTAQIPSISTAADNKFSKRKRELVPWTEEQRSAVKTFF